MSNANTVCSCGARYSAFRSTDGAGNTLSFADVREMMRVGSDDPELWLCRSRGAVLRFWSFLKRSQWDAMHGYCEMVLAAQSVATDSTAEELPSWVTDSTETILESYTGDETVATTTEIITVEIVTTDSTLTNQNASVSLVADDEDGEQSGNQGSSGAPRVHPLAQARDRARAAPSRRRGLLARDARGALRQSVKGRQDRSRGSPLVLSVGARRGDPPLPHGRALQRDPWIRPVVAGCG